MLVPVQPLSHFSFTQDKECCCLISAALVSSALSLALSDSMALGWKKDKEGFQSNSKLEGECHLKWHRGTSQTAPSCQLFKMFKSGTITMYYFGIRRNDEVF